MAFVVFVFQSQLFTNRSKLLIKLIIKNAVRLILDNFGIVGSLFFGRIPVDLSHFSLHFDSFFMLNVLKRSLILAYTDQLAADRRM
jgi:hypothetical protein